jgi:GxxExxY protein
MPALLHRELTGDLIGAYYEVYNHTPRTYPEAIFESALVVEIRQRGYEITRQDEYQIFYKERLVGVQRLDLFVVHEVVVENKVVENLTPLNKAQGMSYLKTVGKQVGLIFNFGSDEPEFDRLFFDPVAKTPAAAGRPPSEATVSSADWLYPDLAYTILGGLFEVHSLLGPGFIHRIYANACHHELRLRGLALKPLKRMVVEYKGVNIGTVAFGHLIVEGRVMVFPVALRSIRQMQPEGLKDWMRACGVHLGIIANFNAVRMDPVFVRA